jgi:hypothetical protein
MKLRIHHSGPGCASDDKSPCCGPGRGKHGGMEMVLLVMTMKMQMMVYVQRLVTIKGLFMLGGIHTSLG